MAKNKVEIDVKVDDKGTTKKVGLGAKQASENLNSAARSAQTADRNIKGAAQASANGTKNFSKMAQGIGGKLVPAYATLAANVFAVTAAFNAFRRAAQLDELEKSLIRTGNIAGRNLGATADSLKEITDNAIDSELALRAVAQGTTQGFSTGQLQDLTKIAKGASIALGREMPDALDRLIRGTAKLEPEILDELGIIVRLDQASSDYAATLGKTAGQLTAFEKQQAFANAVTEQGLKKFGQISKAAEVNPYDKLAAAFSNLTKVFFEGLNVVFTPIIEFLSQKPTALLGVVALFASTIINQLTPALGEMAEESREKFSALSKSAKKAADAVQTKYGAALKNLKELKISPAGFKSVEAAIRSGTNATEALKKGLKSLEASERKRIRDIKVLKTETQNLRGVQKAAHVALIAEKERELGLIQQQISAVKSLQAIDKTGQSMTSVGSSTRQQNTAAASRIGRTEAGASRLMTNAGPLKQFAIAGAAAAKMTAQVGKASGAVGKLGTAFKVGAASARLFGAAMLNAIPYIGQILFIGTLVYEVLTSIFGSPFDDTALEKTIKSIEEKMSKLGEASKDVRAAMRDVGNEAEAMFIKLKAGAGQTDQAIAAINDLVQTAEGEVLGKLTELRNKAAGEFSWTFFFSQDRTDAIRAIEATGVELGQITSDMIKQQAAKANQELLDSQSKESIVISKNDALDGLRAIRDGLSSGGIVPDKVIKELIGFSETIEGIDTDKIPVELLEEFKKRLIELNKPAALFVGAIEGLGAASTEFDNQFSKFLNKQQTPFSGLLTSAETLEGTFLSINKNIKETGYSQGQVNDLIEEAGGKSAKAYADFLRKTEAYTKSTGTETERLAAASTAYTDSIRAADEQHRSLKATLDENSVAQNRIKEFAKTSVFFNEELLMLEQDALDTKLSLLKVEEESLASKKDEEGTADRLKQIDKERTALQAEQNRLAEDAVRAAETAFNQKKAELDVANRLTGALMEQSKIQESMEVLQDKKELREAKRGFAFDFIDQGRLELQQKIEAAQRALSADELKNQADINKGKKAIISAEYVLLRARLEAAATEAASRAGGANEAARLRGLAGTLSESERVALSNIDSGEIARQGGLKETLENLKEANNELSSMEQITNSLETSITSGLTTALDGLIQGTMSVKEAFASMAQGILRALSQVIAELIAIQILKSIISGFSVSAGSAQALALQPQLPGLGSQALAASAPNITARNGGMFEKAPGYATGGIARGREAGYPAILHGTEAVVPLPNGKSIPVEMQKGGQQMNNVTVNVSMDGGGNGQQTSQSSGQQGASLGAAIATAVQKELQNQKRSGGILNPYGVA